MVGIDEGDSEGERSERRWCAGAHHHLCMQRGNTALISGVKHGAREGITRLLLQHNANVNHTNQVCPWARVTGTVHNMEPACV